MGLFSDTGFLWFLPKLVTPDHFDMVLGVLREYTKTAKDTPRRNSETKLAGGWRPV